MDTQFISSKESMQEYPLVDGEDLAYAILKKKYGISLPRVPVFVSNKDLFPWQGGVLWSYESAKGLPSPVIQIRKNCGKGCLRSYTVTEVLSHELVHAARFALKEPLFEEILAYKTSNYWFRRLFGPLFVYMYEPVLLFGSLCVFLCLFIGWDIEWSIWIPLILLAYLVSRLFLLQGLFFLAKKKIQKILPIEEQASRALLYATDKKVICFALFSLNKIKNRMSDLFK